MLTNWKLIEDSRTGKTQYHLDGSVWYGENETKVYECHLQDSESMPSTPQNPGSLETDSSPIFTLNGVTFYGGINVWLCVDRCVTRDYSSPLSTVYRETWQRTGQYYEMKEKPEE